MVLYSVLMAITKIAYSTSTQICLTKAHWYFKKGVVANPVKDFALVPWLEAP